MRTGKHKHIIIILSIFVLLKLLSLSFYPNLWWDPAVYIGMGKYIYSFGHAGLWENSRPLVWSIVLGALWKLNLDVVLFGRIAEIIFGSLCILLAYLIGKKLFDGKTAVLASLFLAISPIFFFFNGIMLSETVSTFFSLLGIYIFISKKYTWAGIFLGIAFMTRFLQIFVLAAAILSLLLQFNKKSLKNILKMLAGFSIAASPFLILNQVLYGNVLEPFLQQAYLSKNSGWLNHHPAGYYLAGILKENFFSPLFVFGAFFALIGNNPGRRVIGISAVSFFAFFMLISQKEMRFLIVLLPYLYLLLSFSTLKLLDILNSGLSKKILVGIIMLLFILFAFNTYNSYGSELSKTDNYAQLRNRFESDSVKGNLWVSNPIIAASSAKKIAMLMYYPVFNENKKEELAKEFRSADFIFLDSCDLECRPYDKICENSKSQLIKFFEDNIKSSYASKISGCMQFVFEKHNK